MRKGIMVTGATGFVGRYVVKALRDSGVTVYPHSSAAGDIANCTFDQEHVEHVFHLAARTFVPDSWHDPAAFYSSNVVGTVNVLEFCRRSGASLTFVSSYVYGKPDHLPIAEDHPVRAFNPYSHTKILAEEAVRYYGSQFGVRWVIVRPFNLYGSGQEERFLIPTLLRQALDSRCSEITVADLRPRRDYLHVRDLVSLLLHTRNFNGCAVFNAGSGKSLSIEEIVKEVGILTGQPKPVRSALLCRPDEVLDVVADISKARNELGWQPEIGMREGLQEMLWSESGLASI